MSADNWAVCPRCLARAQAEWDTQSERVAAMYGSVPVAEFDVARAALPDRPHWEGNTSEATFREDYEFYTHDGMVEVSYKGHCQTCGLHCEFQQVETFWDGSLS